MTKYGAAPAEAAQLQTNVDALPMAVERPGITRLARARLGGESGGPIDLVHCLADAPLALSTG